MNKKLEEWLDKNIDKFEAGLLTVVKTHNRLRKLFHREDFKDGFTAALDLDLLVKFAEWKDKELTLDKFPDCYNYIEKKLEYYAPQYGYTEKYPLKFDHSKYELKSNEELFQYYLEHVHKFE